MGTLTRNGTALHYEEAGTGDPPILFVHGWCCNNTYFAPQIEHFASKHRVVAVDLRGHGSSDKPEQDYTIPGFAEDLAWMCAELGLTKPIVVGHSMGAISALQLAASFPDVPAAIVMVDPAPIIPVAGLQELMAPVVEALHGEGYRDVQRTLVEDFLFIPTDEPALKARVVEEMGSAPQHVMASAFAGMQNWDGEAAARAVRVPALMILAGEGTTDMNRLKDACPDLAIGRTVGAGHFNQLLVPDQINAMIARFVECLTLSPAASPA